MAVLHDLYCKRCDGPLMLDQWVDAGRTPDCSDCGEVLSVALTRVNTDLDHQVHAPTIDAEHPWMSVREARRRAREKGLEPAASADHEHGSRNEEHMRLGKITSGGGLTKRSSYDKDYGAGVGQRT